MPNDRSDDALRERLEIAGKATPEDENTLWTVDPAVRGDLCITKKAAIMSLIVKVGRELK